MSKWNVLVIDDEASQSNTDRHKAYLKLGEQTYDARGFCINFAKNVDDARQKLATYNSDIVLLDVKLKLNGWDDDDAGTIFKELFRLASRNSLVSLVSEYWSDSSMVLVRDFLLNQEEIDQPLMFTFKDFTKDGFAAVVMQIATYIRRKKSLYRLDLSSDSPFRILHISDMHFGASETQRTLANIPKINHLCDRIKSEWPQGPHVIAVTGDIANSGHPKEYSKAFEWFKFFCDKLGIPSLPSPRLLLVPGNHDVSIPLAGSQKLGLVACSSADDVETKSVGIVDKTDNFLCAYAIQPFKEFAAKVSATKGAWCDSPIGYWTEYGFAEYGVVFSGFNTSKKIGANSWPVREIDENDIDQVITGCKQNNFSSLNKGILHISLSHHSPVQYPKVREPVSSSDLYIERFLNENCAPRLLLHGHQHSRCGELLSGNKYMVIGGASPSGGQQSPDVARGVNMLTLERTGSCVKKIRAKSFIYLEGNWTLGDLPGQNEIILRTCE